MSLRRAFSSIARNATDWNRHESFFNFTRGRFVSGEAEQMAQRRVRFNMNELCRLAGEKLGSRCVDVRKCPDGMYNKAFVLRMENGIEVVAKVPNPNAGRAHFITASEVATIDFMRNVMETPVPRVLAWSFNARNAVEAEYIIMEKAEGVQLDAIWTSLDDKQKVKVIREIAMHQLRWADTHLDWIGSLYYAEDLQATDDARVRYTDRETGIEITDRRFAIGPICSREWTDHGRAAIECNRGPWSSTETYRRAEIERDLTALQAIKALPRPLSMLCGPGLYQPEREKKQRAAKLALEVLEHAIPSEQLKSSFHMWHNDLHAENVFVREDDPTEITAIIDWQSTVIAPLFDHNIVPAYLDRDGMIPRGMERPTVPNLRDNASEEEWSAVWAQLEYETLGIGFKHLLKGSMPLAFDALMWQESEASRVSNSCRNLLENSEAFCLASILSLEGDNLPVRFSEEEAAEIRRDLDATHDSVRAMQTIERHLGDLFPDKGLVRHDQYEASKRALRQVKEQVIEDFSKSEEDRRVWQEVWPFDD